MSKNNNSGVVLARIGATTINIAEDNKIYVMHKGKAAFATAGAKGIIHYDREGFKPPKAVTAEVARFLAVQRSNRMKHWHRDSPDHYDRHELELVTEFH